MKKSLFLAITLLIATAGFAQQRTVEQLFRYAAAAEGAQRTELSGSDIPDTGIPGVRIEKLEVINFQNLDDETQEQLQKSVLDVNDPAYELLVSVSESDNKVRILGKTAGEKLTEMVVLVCNDETVLVWLSGDMDKEAVLNMSQPAQ